MQIVYKVQSSIEMKSSMSVNMCIFRIMATQTSGVIRSKALTFFNLQTTGFDSTLGEVRVFLIYVKEILHLFWDVGPDGLWT